jgi:hypothetical protein
MNACFSSALLVRPTSTSYDHKRELQNFQSEYGRIITLELKFLNGHTCNFGQLITHEVYLQQSNGLDALFKSTRNQTFLKCDLAKWAPQITKIRICKLNS